jgi:hypothetical protein
LPLRIHIPSPAIAPVPKRWAPVKDANPLLKMQKQVQSVLNKITREKFDRLSQQLLDIPMESFDMLRALVEQVFDKVGEVGCGYTKYMYIYLYTV